MRRGVTAGNLIRIMCPNLSCQRVLAVPESARGKVVRCRACGINIKIPMPRLQAPSAPAKPAPDADAGDGPAKRRAEEGPGASGDRRR
jgi:hypothetical protein